MAELRRGKQKRKQVLKDVLEKPTKEEYAVAKYLRFHSSLNKDGKFLGNNVHYFLGSKAVDLLMESKWSSKHAKPVANAPLSTRSSCELYCERLLEKGFFHRVAKYEKRDKRKKLKEVGEKKATREDVSKKSEKKSKKEEGELEKDKETEEKDVKEKDAKSAEEKQKEDASAEEKKRRKKKAKLEMHEQQLFIDGPELYVWIYDPVPAKTFIIGLLLVFGAIAVCLFPLWPPEVRLGVYYLSVAAACFIGLIIFLCIVRVILFAIVWAATMGKISFWLLPNLTEDVGFFDSFRPAYQYTVNTKTDKEDATLASEGSGEAATETDKKVDGVEEKVEDLPGADEDVEEQSDEEDEDMEENDEVGVDEDAEPGENDDEEECGRSGSSNSNDNGYEMVDVEDVQNVEEEKEDGEEAASAVRQRKGKKYDRPRQS